MLNIICNVKAYTEKNNNSESLPIIYKIENTCTVIMDHPHEKFKLCDILIFVCCFN